MKTSVVTDRDTPKKSQAELQALVEGIVADLCDRAGIATPPVGVVQNQVAAAGICRTRGVAVVIHAVLAENLPQEIVTGFLAHEVGHLIEAHTAHARLRRRVDDRLSKFAFSRGLGWNPSWRREFAADRAAADLVGAELIHEALDTIRDPREASWSHPSIDARLARLAEGQLTRW